MMNKNIILFTLFICTFFTQISIAQLQITVYIKNNCAQCDSEIKKMKEAGLEFKIKNIDKIPQAKKEVIAAMGSAEYIKAQYYPIMLMENKENGFSGHAYYEIADFAIQTNDEIALEKTDENMPDDYPDNVIKNEENKHEENKAEENNPKNNPPSSNVAKEMVERHNYWRAQLGIAPVAWSDELAKYAQEWANELARKGCQLEHRPYSGKWKQLYGENIYWIGGAGATPKAVVDSWAAERKDFDYNTQECKGEWYVCGHYTQVIWEKTTQIGCAMAKCGDQEIWVCNYNPPGNFNGEKPYKKK